jgi:hypothetical protein
MSRIETGPVQFGDDWPGIFIRGDNAIGYAMAIRRLLSELEPLAKEGAIDARDANAVLALADLLASCNTCVVALGHVNRRTTLSVYQKPKRA